MTHPRRVSRAGRRALSMILAVALAGCFRGQTRPTPAVSSLVIRNRSIFDVNVFVLPSLASRGVRLGMVVGHSNATFPLRASDLQPGDLLVVQVHAIGARTTWTSDAVSVDADRIAVLDVNADPFGDCSRSVLHTVLTTENGPALQSP